MTQENWWQSQTFRAFVLYLVTMVANAVARKWGYSLNAEEIAGLTVALVGFIAGRQYKQAKLLDNDAHPVQRAPVAPGAAPVSDAASAEALKELADSVKNSVEGYKLLAARFSEQAEKDERKWREGKADSERGKPGVLPSVLVPLLLVATMTSASGCAWWQGQPKLRADLSACATTVVVGEVEALMGEAARAIQGEPQTWGPHLDALLARGGQAALCAVLALADALSGGTGGSQTDPLGDYDRSLRAAYLREWAARAEAAAR